MLPSLSTLSIAAAAAALVAGLTVFLNSGVPEASAAPLEGDRLPIAASGTACSSQGWPNFEKKCQFDLRQPANEARIVRIVIAR